MSGRLPRKVLREQGLKLHDAGQEPDGEEDGDDSPPSAAPSWNPFDLLDDQDDEQDADLRVGASDQIEQDHTVTSSSSHKMSMTTRKSKKKKKKSKEISSEESTSKQSIVSNMQDLSIDMKSLDKPDVNDSRTVSELQVDKKMYGTSSILTVNPKYLKAENELRKIFGSKVVNSFENHQMVAGARNIRGGRRAAHIPRKTILVSPSGHWPRWDGSLSMEHLESKNGVHYFRYVHCSSMHAQEAFEAAKATHDLNAIASILERYPYHVEALLSVAEVFKFYGQHQSYSDTIAKCLYALECAWHHLFSPLQGNCQLKYSHDTNKPLFQALFCHMNYMERRGCHRSALEVCKLLLSLDPDDPMGALFCIDYFALRAQEFVWLEQFSEEYQSDNSIWLFPNFSYSLAVCRFYLECDASTKEPVAKSEKATANDLMKQALMLHPLVLKKVVDKAPLKDKVWTELLNNSIFKSAQAGNPSLEHLTNIYVERSYILWRLPELQSLLKEAALQVVESLKGDGNEAKDWACVRREAFSSEKNEYSHLLVSDFSDTVATLPPEEIRHFMEGPQMIHEIHNENREVHPEEARVLREVAGRNPMAVFLESLLPWVDYGVDRNHQMDAHDQHEQQ